MSVRIQRAHFYQLILIFGFIPGTEILNRGITEHYVKQIPFNNQYSIQTQQRTLKRHVKDLISLYRYILDLQDHSTYTGPH